MGEPVGKVESAGRGGRRRGVWELGAAGKGFQDLGWWGPTAGYWVSRPAVAFPEVGEDQRAPLGVRRWGRRWDRRGGEGVVGMGGDQAWVW